MPFGTGKRRKSKPEDKPKTFARRYFDAQPAVRAVNSNAGQTMGAARAATAKLSVPNMSGVRAGLNRAAEVTIDKAVKVNRIMFPSLSQAAADLPPPRVNAANFPAKGYAKRKSTKADQPARARYKDLRKALRKGRRPLQIPMLGGY